MKWSAPNLCTSWYVSKDRSSGDAFVLRLGHIVIQDAEALKGARNVEHNPGYTWICYFKALSMGDATRLIRLSQWCGGDADALKYSEDWPAAQACLRDESLKSLGNQAA